jgi:hypothetical protein
MSDEWVSSWSLSKQLRTDLLTQGIRVVLGRDRGGGYRRSSLEKWGRTKTEVGDANSGEIEG